MITSNIVLVLGAGASAHCEYPLGQVLYNKILDNLEPIIRNNQNKWDEQDIPERLFRDFEPHIQLLKLDYSVEDVSEFRQALLYADRPSIDRFLERRTDYIEIGKICIAQALIPFEKNIITNRDGHNWYQLLFNILDFDVKGFHNNKLSIITFNYDRSLEHYLFKAVKHTYGMSDDEHVAALVKSIPIVHVHGQLDFLNWQTTRGGEHRNYGETLTKENLRRASKSIKIIHEDISKDPQFTKAKNLIKEAKSVFFLGFGYEATNLKRLGLEANINNNFIGTGYKLTPNVYNKAMSFFESISKTIKINGGQDIVTLLNNINF